MTTQIVNANDVVGVNVKNMQKEDLGEIKAVMLDKQEGRVAYAVLSYGGFLGMGNKLFALPWSMLSYNKTDDCFMISLDEEKLKKSPGFDKDHWPDMTDTIWSNSIHKYYGTSHSNHF